MSLKYITRTRSSKTFSDRIFSSRLTIFKKKKKELLRTTLSNAFDLVRCISRVHFNNYYHYYRRGPDTRVLYSKNTADTGGRKKIETRTHVAYYIRNKRITCVREQDPTQNRTFVVVQDNVLARRVFESFSARVLKAVSSSALRDGKTIKKKNKKPIE